MREDAARTAAMLRSEQAKHGEKNEGMEDQASNKTTTKPTEPSGNPKINVKKSQ